MRFFSRLLALLAFSNLSLGAPLEDRTLVTPPTEDAFYDVPADIESFSPGAIIRSRKTPAPIAAFGLFPVNLDGTWQILYRTNDNLGSATATVLTILVPHKADYTKVLSYQVAEDAAALDCAPSYALQLASATGGPLGTLITQAELVLMQIALEQGWVVIVPDFQGPEAAYLANVLAGQATLDGIRAALNSHDLTSISKDPTIALWGYSGGSLAALSAAELQPSYAPELKIAGVAAGGIVPSIPPAIESTDGTPFAGLIPTGIVGLANQYPEIAELLDEHLLPKSKAAFDKVKTQCFVSNVVAFLGKNVTAMFDDFSFLTEEPVKRILEDNALGIYTPKIPLYMYKAVRDEVSPSSETDQLVEKYCSDGGAVTYVRDRTAGHGDLAITAAGGAVSWLTDVFNGRTPTKTCSTKNVIFSILDPASLKVLPRGIVDVLLNLLGRPIGPGFFG